MSDPLQEQQKTTAPLTPGEWLRQERERQGRTVQQIATDLHLSTQMIDAIETNQFAVLGAPVFARGHLRKYANVLGLPVDRVQELYQSLSDRPRDQDPVPVMHRATEPSIPMSPDSKQRRAQQLPALMTVVIAGGALLVVAVIAWLVLSGSKHSKSESNQPTTSASNAESAVTSEAATTELMRPASPQADSNANNPSVGPGVKKPNDKERDGNATKADEAKLSDARRAGSSQAGQQVGQQVGQLAQSAGQLARGKVRLRFNFTQESWVEVYDARGTRMLYDVGLPGQTRGIDVEAPAQVVLGLASAVGTEINGRAVTVPTRRIASQVARFTVLADGAVQ